MVENSKFKTLGKEQKRESKPKEEIFIQPEREEVNNSDKYEKKPKRKKTRGFKGVLVGLIAVVILGVAGVATNGFGLLNGSKDKDVIYAPDLVNMSLKNANKVVYDLDLKLTINERHDPDVEKDHVISQTPPKGTELKKGDTITIVISLGPEELTAPNLLGFALQDAKKILEQYGLSLGSVSYEYSEIYKEGTVINQNPVAGAGNIKKGDSINIVVSKGQKVEQTPVEDEKPSEDENSDQNNDNNNSNNSTDNNTNGNNNNDNNSNNNDGNNDNNGNNPDNTQDGNGNSGDKETSNVIDQDDEEDDD